MCDCLVLLPPVPPPLSLILFHSWPQKTARHICGHHGTPQVWPGESSSRTCILAGLQSGALGPFTRGWRCHFPFPQKDCPARVPAPHFSFQHAFLDRDTLSPPTSTFPENLLGFALQALRTSHSQEYEKSKGKMGMGSGLSLPESESQL